MKPRLQLQRTRHAATSTCSQSHVEVAAAAAVGRRRRSRSSVGVAARARASAASSSSSCWRSSAPHAGARPPLRHRGGALLVASPGQREEGGKQQQHQHHHQRGGPARATELGAAAMIPSLVAASTAVGNALWARAARQAFVREVCRAFNVGDPEELQVCVMRWLGVCGGWEGLKGGREAATLTQSDPGTRQLSRFSSPACARLANCCRRRPLFPHAGN